MGINRTHPDYKEYSKKHKLLWDAYFELQESERSKYPNWEGLDHPADNVLRDAFRKLSEDIEALQKEYNHIFLQE